MEIRRKPAIDWSKNPRMGRCGQILTRYFLKLDAEMKFSARDWDSFRGPQGGNNHRLTSKKHPPAARPKPNIVSSTASRPPQERSPHWPRAIAPNPKLSHILEFVEPWDHTKSCFGFTRHELGSITATFIAAMIVLVSDSKSMPEKSNALTAVCWGRRHSNDPTAGGRRLSRAVQDLGMAT